MWRPSIQAKGKTSKNNSGKPLILKSSLWNCQDMNFSGLNHQSVFHRYGRPGKLKQMGKKWKKSLYLNGSTGINRWKLCWANHPLKQGSDAQLNRPLQMR